MRILMTTDAMGGVWTFTRELSTELLKRDCSLMLASVGPPPTTRQNKWVEEQSNCWRGRFHFVALNAPLEWMTDNRQAYSAGAKELMSLMNSFRPDVLLSSQYCFGALPVSIPRIVVAHSDVLSWARACRPFGLEPTGWLERYCSMVSAGIRQADAVVAPTQWMLDAIALGFELPLETHVIPNGCTQFPEEIQPLRKLRAVTAGRLWDEAKNLKILEEVNSSIPILVAGELECDSARYGQLSTKLHFQGTLDRAELLKLFRQSMIYICTSIYEPFGFAPIEAAQCGCAVVANDLPSLREVWGDSALFFEDERSLSTLLSMLRENSRFRARARYRARLRALEFTSERMAGRYFDLLRKFVPQREAGSCAA